MDRLSTLRRHGLFDAKVPRYTSYPPANRFVSGTGKRLQKTWLAQVSRHKPVSVYVHIPFCRRLCWFCACRTQGTQTLQPVEHYVTHLLNEIGTIAKTHVPRGLKMSRLHLGGGTPTLLSPVLMNRLLERIHQCFEPNDDFEFSVEVDPTEAPSDVLDVLSNWQMTRASIGVQDLHPKVQKAIGRLQGFDVTQHAIDALRQRGVDSLNIDFLYGLPHQTAESLAETLDRVVSLRPDRLALYGYAHVPHMSKRQVMIPEDALPDAEQRFVMSDIARNRLIMLGYEPLGIDHFALPHDSLTRAARAGTMTRNFQGYTDDPCATLIGFGASAISRFPQGYLQNAVSTSAYCQSVTANGVAGHKGISLTEGDHLIASMIDSLMCDGEVRTEELKKRFPNRKEDITQLIDELLLAYPELLMVTPDAIVLPGEMAAASRLIAAHLDHSLQANHVHSLAV